MNVYGYDFLPWSRIRGSRLRPTAWTFRPWPRRRSARWRSWSWFMISLISAMFSITAGVWWTRMKIGYSFLFLSWPSSFKIEIHIKNTKKFIWFIYLESDLECFDRCLSFDLDLVRDLAERLFFEFACFSLSLEDRSLSDSLSSSSPHRSYFPKSPSSSSSSSSASMSSFFFLVLSSLFIVSEINGGLFRYEVTSHLHQ